MRKVLGGSILSLLPDVGLQARTREPEEKRRKEGVIKGQQVHRTSCACELADPDGAWPPSKLERGKLY